MEGWSTPGCTLHPSELNPLLGCAPRDVLLPTVPLQAVTLRGVVPIGAASLEILAAGRRELRVEFLPLVASRALPMWEGAGGEGPVRRIPLQAK